MNEVTTEVIGAIEGNVLVIERGDSWSMVVMYTYSGAFSYNRDEVGSLVEFFTAALEKL